jgi:DNA segregation ATPase FtsK/SpoIIIE, S-DNA-T family
MFTAHDTTTETTDTAQTTDPDTTTNTPADTATNGPENGPVKGAATAYEIELDEAPPATAEPVPVDAKDSGATVHKVHSLDPANPSLGTAAGAVLPEGARRPIIPPALRRANVKATAKRTGGRAAHVAGYHAARCPWYLAKTLGFAIRGLGRLIKKQMQWWWVPGSVAMEQHAAKTNQLIEWERVHRQLKATRMWRGTMLALEALAVGIGVPVFAGMAPGWGLLAAATGAVLGLARFGRPEGHNLIGQAVVAPRFRKLNSDIVLRAYYAAGLGNPNKDDQQVHFGSPMSRDARNIGSQVVIDLPWGKGWSDVVNVREKLASGLDVHVNQVFLTPDKTSSRRHTLFVADRDPLAVPVGRTDMLDLKPRSIWRPVRFGKDERGNQVDLTLMWVSVLVGAQPRKGKTFAARLIALHAALDPFVKLYVIDGKNSPDWIKFRLVAHRMVFGTHPSPNDDDPVGNLMAVLDEILAHIDRVNQQLAALPVSVCPEGKLTEELARDPRYPDLRVVLLVMEEFQVYFETEDQETNKAIAAKLSRIQAVGPSAGVCILSSSQKPSGVGAGDVGRLFNRYRDNHAVRFALKCGNRTVSEAVLGGDAYSEGYDASGLPVGDEYRGVGYLYGQSDATPTVRTLLADHGDAEKILTAARAHRERVGTLTGQAIGETIERDVRDVLADAATVFYADKSLPWQVLAARLADTFPEHYADLTADTISTQLRALKVPSVNVKRDGSVLKGAKADDLTAARNRRDGDSTTTAATDRKLNAA